MLVHQKDVCATVGSLSRVVRPGGVVAFQEIDIEARCWSEPRFPLLERTADWIVSVFLASGASADIGRRMARACSEAGIVDRRIIREGIMDAGPDTPVYEYCAETLRALPPALTRLGLATEDEVQIDTLADRLRAEATALGEYFIPIHLVSASGRVPA